MSGGELLLFCEEPDARALGSLADSVLSHWPAATRPRFTIASPAQLAAMNGDAAAFGAAWVYVGPDAERSRVYQMLHTCKRSGARAS